MPARLPRRGSAEDEAHPGGSGDGGREPETGSSVGLLDRSGLPVEQAREHDEAARSHPPGKSRSELDQRVGQDVGEHEVVGGAAPDQAVAQAVGDHGRDAAGKAVQGDVLPGDPHGHGVVIGCHDAVRASSGRPPWQGCRSRSRGRARGGSGARARDGRSLPGRPGWWRARPSRRQGRPRPRSARHRRAGGRGPSDRG